MFQKMVFMPFKKVSALDLKVVVNHKIFHPQTVIQMQKLSTKSGKRDFNANTSFCLCTTCRWYRTAWVVKTIFPVLLFKPKDMAKQSTDVSLINIQDYNHCGFRWIKLEHLCFPNWGSFQQRSPFVTFSSPTAQHTVNVFASLENFQTAPKRQGPVLTTPSDCENVNIYRISEYATNSVGFPRTLKTLSNFLLYIQCLRLPELDDEEIEERQ